MLPSQGELIIEWDDVLCRPIYRRRCRLGSKFEADKNAAGGVTKVLMNGKRQPRQAGTVSLSPPEVSAALLEECHDDHASDGSALLSASQHPDRFHRYGRKKSSTSRLWDTLVRSNNKTQVPKARANPSNYAAQLFHEEPKDTGIIDDLSNAPTPNNDNEFRSADGYKDLDSTDESETQGERSPTKEDEGKSSAKELESNRVPSLSPRRHCDYSPFSPSCTWLAPPFLDASDFDLNTDKSTNGMEEKLAHARKSYRTVKSKPLWKGANNQSERTIRTSSEHGLVDWDDTLARPVFKRGEATAVAALSDHSTTFQSQANSRDLAEARATKKIRRVYKSHYRNLVQTQEDGSGTEYPSATSNSSEYRGFDGSRSDIDLESMFDFDQEVNSAIRLQSARTYFSKLDKTSLTVSVE